MEDNYFLKLFNVNVSDKIEKKNGLSYVSWVYAWAEVKKRFPDATYRIYENANGWFYHTDGRTCWVKTGLTVNGIEHIEMLPVMDFKNRSIPADAVTSTDVNKAIQRSLTKAAARHGIGLYVYAGEDLPECEAEKKEEKPEQKETQTQAYLRKNIPLMMKAFGVTEEIKMKKYIAEWKKALIAGGIIQDVKFDDMTVAQAEELINAIYANYKPGDAA
jgi:hypothetical protein